MRWLASAMTAGLMAVVGGAAWPLTQSRDTGLASTCAPAVAAQRERWHAVAPPSIQPPAGPGEQLRHWATSTAGAWIVERQAPGEASLTRVAPDQIKRIQWTAPACQPSEDSRARVPATPPAFTDRDLDTLVRAQRPVMLYLWSPHMPLSVDGWAEAQRAATARGITVEPLLDPQADRGFAATSAKAAGLPDSALRVVDSVELQFRELALHAPSLAVIGGARMLGAPLRGYRTADEYGTFLDRVVPR